MPPKKQPHKTIKKATQPKTTPVPPENSQGQTPLWLAVAQLGSEEKELSSITKLLQQNEVDLLAISQACINGNNAILDLFLKHKTCSITHVVFAIFKLEQFLQRNPYFFQSREQIKQKLRNHVLPQLTQTVIQAYFQQKEDEIDIPFMRTLFDLAAQKQLLDKPFLDALLVLATAKKLNNLIPLLLEKGADINTGGLSQCSFSPATQMIQQVEVSPLIVAAQYGNLKAVQLFCEVKNLNIDKAVNVTEVGKPLIGTPGTFVASDATVTEQIEEIKDAFEAAKNTNKAMTVAPGATALICAIQNGHDEIARTLIENKANLNAVSLMGETAAMFAVYYGRLKTLQLLLRHNAAVRGENYYGQTIFAILLARKKFLDSNDKALFTEMSQLLLQAIYQNEVLTPLLCSLQVAHSKVTSEQIKDLLAMIREYIFILKPSSGLESQLIFPTTNAAVFKTLSGNLQFITISKDRLKALLEFFLKNGFYKPTLKTFCQQLWDHSLEKQQKTAEELKATAELKEVTEQNRLVDTIPHRILKLERDQRAIEALIKEVTNDNAEHREKWSPIKDQIEIYSKQLGTLVSEYKKPHENRSLDDLRANKKTLDEIEGYFSACFGELTLDKTMDVRNRSRGEQKQGLKVTEKFCDQPSSSEQKDKVVKQPDVPPSKFFAQVPRPLASNQDILKEICLQLKEAKSFEQHLGQLVFEDLVTLRVGLLELCRVTIGHLAKLDLPAGFLSKDQLTKIYTSLCRPHDLAGYVGGCYSHLDNITQTQEVIELCCALCKDIEVYFPKLLSDKESKASKDLSMGCATLGSKLGKILYTHTPSEIDLNKDSAPYIRQFFTGLDGLLFGGSANSQLVPVAIQEAAMVYNYNVHIGFYGKTLCLNPCYAHFIFMLSNHPHKAPVIEFLQNVVYAEQQQLPEVSLQNACIP